MIDDSGMKFSAWWLYPLIIETSEFDRSCSFRRDMNVFFGEEGFTTINDDFQLPIGTVLRAPAHDKDVLTMQWTGADWEEDII